MHPQEHMKLYETRVNLRRFDEVAPLISAEAVFWFTDGSYHGIDAIKAAFEETWRKLQNEVYWLEDVDWIATSDTSQAARTASDGRPILTGKLTKATVVARPYCARRTRNGRSSTSTSAACQDDQALLTGLSDSDEGGNGREAPPISAPCLFLPEVLRLREE